MFDKHVLPTAVSLVVCFCLTSACSTTIGLADDAPAAGQEIVLWPNGAPGAIGDEPRDRPVLAMHAPAADRHNGCAVIVCPGGGYSALADSHEGHDVARWFNTFGVTGFVLRYRHAPHYRHPAPLSDIQRAIRSVRARAEAFRIDPERIGVMGFSAGGHLASTAATHFDTGDPNSDDVIERAASRPDFAILAYPVISLTTEYTHRGSLRNLLGENPDPALVESLSSEKQVTAKTPPTFLFHTSDDRGVPAENSVLFYLALRKAGVPAELHVYEPGPHGVGLAGKYPTLSNWPERLKMWMQHRQLLRDKHVAKSTIEQRVPQVDSKVATEPTNPQYGGKAASERSDRQHDANTTAPANAPQYDSEGRLQYPAGFRNWVFVGASLGLSYSDRFRDKKSQFFHNVYITPAAYEQYARTGRFPDGTVLAMPVYSQSDKSEATFPLQGTYEREFVSLEVTVKDSSRFDEEWAYFDFPAVTDKEEESRTYAERFPQSKCYDCHAEHAADDNVFVQFYPVLRRLKQQESR